MDERTTVRLATVPDIGIDGLRKVNAATVVIVGCGGLGHPAALYLAAAGVNRIILVDPDVVELSNLGRQILFDSGDVGQQKTTVLRHRLSAAHPHLEVVTLVGEIGDSATDLELASLLLEKTPVLDCTDNFGARHAVSTFCRESEHWHVWGNVFRWEGSCAVFDPSAGPSYEDFFEDPPWEMRVTCASGGVVGPVCGVIGSVMATQAIKLLVTGTSPLYGELVELDVASGISARRGPMEPSQSNEEELPHSEPGLMLSPGEAIARVNASGVQFIDVREDWERQSVSIPGAIAVPMPSLWHWLKSQDRREPLMFVCASGYRARQATAIAQRLGWANSDVTAVDGAATEMTGVLQ